MSSNPNLAGGASPGRTGPGATLPCAAPWAEEPAAVLRLLSVTEEGLSAEEVVARRALHGTNELVKAQGRSVWRILWAQLRSVVIGLLAVAAVVSLVFGDRIEAAAILTVIALNAAIGFFTEWRAVRSMEALHRLGGTRARVRRGGSESWVPAPALVPGDIVLVEAGDLVAADTRVLEASKLQVNESALTGESMPVSRTCERLAEDVDIVERSNMLHSGTSVVRGSGLGVVTATGMATTLGDIAALASSAKEPRTPLEERLEKLGGQLVWVCLALAVLAAAAGIASGKPPMLMIETAIALAVAAIPEGLPIVATLALARGMLRLARHRALVKTLAAVETLGAASILLSDKTGTLTEDRMLLRELVLPGGVVAVDTLAGREGFLVDGAPPDDAIATAVQESLETVALCTNASLGGEWGSQEQHTRGVGDPVEVALLLAADAWGVTREGLLEEQPEIREEPFDPETKMMATYHQRGDHLRVAVKGAPEEIVPRCVDVRRGQATAPLADSDRQRWLARSEELAGQGLRILAVATRTCRAASDPCFEGLTLLGLVGLLDPPRRDVSAAISAFREAGVRVILVTGDHAATAEHIAREVGLLSPAEDGDTQILRGRDLRAIASAPVGQRPGGSDALDSLLAASVFARTDPAQKLQLVRLHRDRGATVAMIGDGVNDAPALRQADIGIAMGKRGTEVAREAADMVLKDDALGSIVEAIGQGRVIFENIRKFVFYLLSCNVGEILVITLASLLFLPLPILPLQILFLNLVTDVFPALALGFGRGDPGTMQRTPRPRDAELLDAGGMRAICAHGLVIAVTVLVAHSLSRMWLGDDAAGAVTVSFLTLAFAQLWHVFNARGPETTLATSDIVRNPWVWGAFALCSGLLLLTVTFEPLRRVLRVTSLEPRSWAVVIGASLVPLVLGQLWLAIRSRAGSRESGAAARDLLRHAAKHLPETSGRTGSAEGEQA